ncbi:unnamed protein product [Cyclocybe aegerita]|uniref:Uncharacterized protein n=1 Tax=Cyclocybe aegerita TaxID=1973307 RepID=A0A8S0WC00_CYCAE|nr:unnamed protein product [Cyclocybe aegerita]
MLGVLSLAYQTLDWRTVAIGVPAIVVLVHFLSWLIDPHGIRKIPGPLNSSREADGHRCVARNEKANREGWIEEETRGSKTSILRESQKRDFEALNAAIEGRH